MNNKIPNVRFDFNPVAFQFWVFRCRRLIISQMQGLKFWLDSKSQLETRNNIISFWSGVNHSKEEAKEEKEPNKAAEEKEEEADKMEEEEEKTCEIKEEDNIEVEEEEEEEACLLKSHYKTLVYIITSEGERWLVVHGSKVVRFDQIVLIFDVLLLYASSV